MLRGKGAKPEPTEYSRAFDNIVQDDDDVVGLLAYALFKRAVREDAQDGRKSDGNSRNPSRTVVETYRAASERLLGQVIEASLREAKPELQISAALDAIETASSSIREHVTAKTGIIPALLTNVLAWAFTLVVTVLIFLALDRPSPVEVIVDRTKDAITDQRDTEPQG
ncbi:MAG: hypothetical protein EDM03_07445 [Porphyrobacter sp. IPPAS B-1204]|nr:MAG: hypothetical protein EDM03_07445 [Porphyrobacter sp. IPPAS B-1204]